MPKNSVEDKHEFLEIWAILEVQKIWRAVEGFVDLAELSTREKFLYEATVDILESETSHDDELRELRNAIAHADTDSQLISAKRSTEILRELLSTILGENRSTELIGELQLKWSKAPYSTRSRRQELLRIYEKTLGSASEYDDLTDARQASITRDEFLLCKRIRNRTSHPNPPPYAAEVDEAIELLRGFSRRVSAAQREIDLQAAQRAMEIAESQARRAEEKKRIDERQKELAAKRAADDERASKLRAESALKEDRKKREAEARRQMKIDKNRKIDEFDNWRRAFHHSAITAAEEDRPLSAVQRVHLRQSRGRSYLLSIYITMTLTLAGALLVFLSFFFPLLFLVSWIFIAIYFLIKWMMGVGIPSVIVIALCMCPVWLLGETIHRETGWRYVTKETRAESDGRG